jgi:hypothetical protein
MDTSAHSWSSSNVSGDEGGPVKDPGPKLTSEQVTADPQAKPDTNPQVCFCYSVYQCTVGYSTYKEGCF